MYEARYIVNIVLARSCFEFKLKNNKLYNTCDSDCIFYLHCIFIHENTLGVWNIFNDILLPVNNKSLKNHSLGTILLRAGPVSPNFYINRFAQMLVLLI